MEPRINETSFFDSVRQNSLTRWDQLEADPELAAPWRQLFMQVQSPRHVLSELLQNADDAGATWAKASIEDNVFLFEHNGEDFQADHLGSLCRFGQSNKRQLHTIGFRGIGFKSTFSLGPHVEVYTPTLSFSFTDERFTQPNWESEGLKPDASVIVRVSISDVNREEALRENFDEWLNNPASLLFFRNLQELRIEDDRIHRESKGPGPAPGTEWFNLTSNDRQNRVLLARSETEEFPRDSIDEIRKERMHDEVVLPPVSVNIVLGLSGSQKLYAVLPTDVQPDLPFSCNAPFMQDPARSSIKDPSLSPTNHWLLERCGKLAVKVMEQWLRSDKLKLTERSKAYALMPREHVEVRGIADKAADVVKHGFGYGISDHSEIVLTTKGVLSQQSEVIALPKRLHGIWNDEDTCNLLGREHKYLAAKEISTDALKRLSDWLPLFIVRKWDGIQFEFNGSQKVPEPETRDGLLRLWAYFEPEISKRRYLADWKKLTIVPVTGKRYLSSADQVLRLKKEIASDCAAEVVSGLLNIVDETWIDIVRGGLKRASTMENVDNRLVDRLSKANIVLDVIGVSDVTPVNEIVRRITGRVQQESEVSDDLLIKITHLLAAMDAVIPGDFPYLCADGKRRVHADGVLYKPSAATIDLLPAEWLNEHEIDPKYHQETGCCSTPVWNAWASSSKSSLGNFVRPTAKTEKFYNHRKLISYYKNHGCGKGPELKISRHEFGIEDYDFDPQFWEYWGKLVVDDKPVWGRVLIEVGKDIGHIPVSMIQPKAYQYGTTKRHLLDYEDGLVTSWVNRLRSLHCIPDTYSEPRLPEHLMLRNPSTEPLIGVEPFVHSEFDTEGMKLLLSALGVRDKPQDIKSLLTRIRTAPHMQDAPVSDLTAWYRALDSVVADLAEERMDELGIVKIFAEERLIYAENNEWLRSDELFIEEDLDFHEEPIVYKAVNNLPLWNRLGVKRRPTIEHVIQKLKSLAVGERVNPDVSKRIRRWLAREPSIILDSVNCWISIDDVWAGMDEFHWRYDSDSRKARTELFPAVLSKTADLSVLDQTAVPSLLMDLPSLKGVLKYQVTDIVRQGVPELVDWINEIGDCLRLVELGENASDKNIEHVGDQLITTQVQLVDHVEVTPYLDNAPVGVARGPSVFWSGKELYTKRRLGPENADMVIDELVKGIENEKIQNALRFVSMRDPQFIRDYFESHFEMKSTIEEKAALTQAANLDVHAEIGKQQMGQAGHDERKHIIEDDYQENVEELTETSVNFTDVVPSDELTSGTVEPGNQHFVLVDQDANENIQGDDFEEHLPESSHSTFDEIDQLGDEEKETQKSSNAQKVVGKKELFDAYMGMQGFSPSSSSSVYLHPNGDRVQRSQDIFLYERVNSSMDVVTYYHVVNEQLTKGVSIPPDVYKYMEYEPQKVSIITLGENDAPAIIMGDKLLKRIADGEINIFVESYRLVESDVSID